MKLVNQHKREECLNTAPLDDLLFSTMVVILGERARSLLVDKIGEKARGCDSLNKCFR